MVSDTIKSENRFQQECYADDANPQELELPFVDRSPEYFELILQYMRSNGKWSGAEITRDRLKNAHWVRGLQTECDFYLLEGYPVVQQDLITVWFSQVLLIFWVVSAAVGTMEFHLPTAADTFFDYLNIF